MNSQPFIISRKSIILTASRLDRNLANFTSLWLQPGSNAADLDGEADDVDFEDYGIFSSYWQDFCPDGWQLK